MNEIELIIPENFAVDEADEFRENINTLIKNGEKRFKFDFSKCNFIDSTGLGVLVTIYKKCNELDGSIKLHSVNNPQVMKIFNLTRLDNIFGL